MKLATYSYYGSTHVGIIVHDEVVELQAAAPGLPDEMCQLLAGGRDALAAAARAVDRATARIPLDDVRLESPLLRPPKILAAGLNYADHIAESGLQPPEYPVLF